MINEIKKVLSKGKQVILFQNRRGFSSYVIMLQMPISTCKQCDVSLTYHKRKYFKMSLLWIL